MRNEKLLACIIGHAVDVRRSLHPWRCVLSRSLCERTDATTGNESLTAGAARGSDHFTHANALQLLTALRHQTCSQPVQPLHTAPDPRPIPHARIGADRTRRSRRTGDVASPPRSRRTLVTTILGSIFSFLSYIIPDVIRRVEHR